MAQKQHNIYLDLLNHPGETLYEVIQDRNISQRELALRTSYSEKHISTVINGTKDISADFAKKLEYALEIPASFWKNLQSNYDLENVQIQEKNNITKEELLVSNEIKKAVETILEKPIKVKNKFEEVVYLRKILNLSNLTIMKNLTPSMYRAKFCKNISDNIMYVWQYLCEKELANQTNKPFNLDILKNNLNQLKMIMHEDSEKIQLMIRNILNEAGIVFTVKDEIEKLPLNGTTLKTRNNQVMLAMTIRYKFVDIFWFTLFHEIAHILNEDYKTKFNSEEQIQKAEKKADRFASDFLIDPKKYKEFSDKANYSDEAIIKFAKECNVIPSIVVGRINKETNNWNIASHLRQRYIYK